MGDINREISELKERIEKKEIEIQDLTANYNAKEDRLDVLQNYVTSSEAERQLEEDMERLYERISTEKELVKELHSLLVMKEKLIELELQKEQLEAQLAQGVEDPDCMGEIVFGLGSINQQIVYLQQEIGKVEKKTR